jgi:Malectin domain/IPT/TIG domain
LFFFICSKITIDPIRISAGSSSDWVDPETGFTWKADVHFKSGWPYSPGLKAIKGTTQDTLYSSHRTQGSYSIDVPAGTYTVILMFAEIYFGKKDERIFAVSVNGNVLKEKLDLVAAVGANTAYRISTNIELTTKGKINIAMTPVKENTCISGIEILPGIATFAPTSAPVFAPFEPIRINVGGASWTDPATGLVWDEDKFYDGGSPYSIPAVEIIAPGREELFASSRSFFGGFNSIGTYTIPVQQGLYTVNLLFAEPYWAGIKDRVFDVLVMGIKVAAELDLVEVVGPKKEYTISTIATVTPVSQINFMTIAFANIINNGMISAIEIMQYTPPPTSGSPPFPTIRINCGYNTPWVDELGDTWEADAHYTGGDSVSQTFPDILNTNNDLLYFYERAGDIFNYTFNVPAGVYQVNLLFAETRFDQPGERVMDMSVGDKVVKGYDILAVVPKFTATKLTLFALADNGFLSIQISKASGAIASQAAKLDAIEIKLDAPHLAHSVTNGPYRGTVSDESGKAKISLYGQKSHTHGTGLLITTAEWKLGQQSLGNFLNLDYSFPVGNHTVSLAIKDNGGNQNVEVTTVSIRPFGFPTITEIVPSSGSMVGGYDVIIKGAGFTDPASSTTVLFGIIPLTGSAVQIIDQYTIKVTCPETKIGQRVSITVTTTKGSSEEGAFDYIGDVPILWTTGTLFSFLKPTTGRFGPDKKLYVGTIDGKLMKVALNGDFTGVISNFVSQVNPGEESM